MMRACRRRTVCPLCVFPVIARAGGDGPMQPWQAGGGALAVQALQGGSLAVGQADQPGDGLHGGGQQGNIQTAQGRQESLRRAHGVEVVRRGDVRILHNQLHLLHFSLSYASSRPCWRTRAATQAVSWARLAVRRLAVFRVWRRMMASA